MCTVVTLVLILTILCHLNGAPVVKNDVKFSIASSRNRTGHWNALVQFQHGDNDGRPMNVDLNHTTTRFQGHEDVLIALSLSGVALYKEYTPVNKWIGKPEGLTSTEWKETLKMTTNVSSLRTILGRSQDSRHCRRCHSPRQRPGADYEFLPGLGYYKFHTVPKNWFEAGKVCAQEGTHFAIMNSEEESKALRKFWIPHPKLFEDWKNNWAYVGIHDHYNEGNYVTIFDVPLNETGFTGWSPSQPDGGVRENCIVIQRLTGLYGDVPCTYALTFFCEQEL